MRSFYHRVRELHNVSNMGLPKNTFSGVATIRIIVFWGLYWGPLILGNYHISEVLWMLRGTDSMVRRS